MTPQELLAETEVDVTQLVSVIDDPRNPRVASYTVDKLGNVCGGQPVKYLNVPADRLKELARDSIAGGEAVWFGCDVGKFFDSDVCITIPSTPPCPLPAALCRTRNPGLMRRTSSLSLYTFEGVVYVYPQQCSARPHNSNPVPCSSLPRLSFACSRPPSTWPHGGTTWRTARSST